MGAAGSEQMRTGFQDTQNLAPYFNGRDLVVPFAAHEADAPGRVGYAGVSQISGQRGQACQTVFLLYGI
jgi:hypothetical protein